MIISFAVARIAFEYIPTEYVDVRKVIVLLCFAASAVSMIKFHSVMKRKRSGGS